MSPGWAAVRVVSPRRTVRIADVDGSGRALNVYGETVPLGGPEPVVPYAMYLASRGRFALLAFDLDTSKGPVGEDLAQLRAWLEEAGIPYLVAASGPGGGRHVWAAIAGGVPAARVAVLAQALAGRLPTLDITPLMSPVSGCVRPPGARHRAGGVSQIVAGGWEALTGPVATEAHVDFLLALVGPVPALDRPGGRQQAGTGVDGDGHRHLLGPRRALPGASRAALQEPLLAAVDPSVVLWRVLLGAVRARWRYGDVAALMLTPAASPGLEHARSARLVPGRLERAARTPAQRDARLARQWDQAVEFLAASGTSGQDGADSGYLARLQDTLEAVTAVQARAGASVRRWARPGGPADRRVLDHACMVALTAVRDEIDLDTRSVAIATGIGRETARTALGRLAADGWLTLTAAADGPRAARWRLPMAPSEAPSAAQSAGSDPLEKNADLPLSTPSTDIPRSHVVTPPLSGPLPALPLLRHAWLARLGHRLSGQAHDVFTGAPGGLGHAAGALYVALEAGGAGDTGWSTVTELIAATGRAPRDLSALLSALAGAQLACSRTRSPVPVWRARGRRFRVPRARTLGVYGILATRARAIGVDRDVWAWWRAELEWMQLGAAARRAQNPRRSRSHHRRARPGAGQTVLPVAGGPQGARTRFGPYPRTATGRADHAAARIAVASRATRLNAA